jgi:hypothetical protein
MVCLVAAIIEDDIEWPELAVHFGEKRRVRLAADPDENILFLNFVSLAGLVDIDTDDRRVRMKVFLPHAERSSAEYTDLEHGDRPVAIALEIPGVDVEIVMPLVHVGVGRENAK